jgi:hypothetical protein
MVHAYKASTWEAAKVLRVQGQPGSHREILSQKTPANNNLAIHSISNYTTYS